MPSALAQKERNFSCDIENIAGEHWKKCNFCTTNHIYRVSFIHICVIPTPCLANPLCRGVFPFFLAESLLPNVYSFDWHGRIRRKECFFFCYLFGACPVRIVCAGFIFQSCLFCFLPCLVFDGTVGLHDLFVAYCFGRSNLTWAIRYSWFGRVYLEGKVWQGYLAKKRWKELYDSILLATIGLALPCCTTTAAQKRACQSPLRGKDYAI